MSYGSPTKQEGTVTYAALGVVYQSFDQTSITVTINASNDMTELERDAAFQALIDLLDGSADFSVAGGMKAYSTTEEVTVTP